MAASGLVELAEAATIEMSMNRKIPLVQLVNIKGYFQSTLEKNGVRNGSNITKCFEKLNGGLPTKDIEPYLKTSLARNFSEFFAKESFNNRLGRSPSTDSIAVSNFSSGPGSVDSCQYSSNGSDSNSGSSPCSPEESDRCSRAGSPHSMPPTSPANHYCSESEDQLSQAEQNYRTDSSNKSNGSSVYGGNGNTFLSEQSGPAHCENVQLNNSNSENNIKHFYLQDSSCSVPNSNYEPFQNFKSSCGKIPSATTTEESSELHSVDKPVELCKSAGHSNSVVHQTDSKLDFSSSNTSTNQSNCSSTDLQQCSWVHCNTYLEGNTELVEHIRTQHVQVQKEKESFVCLWVGCKVYNRSSCSLSWLERHILTHGGSKPFKCIVDNCNQRFPTQSALQRHVNSHFDSHPNNHSGRAGRCRDETKSFRRKKHNKYKKRSAMGKTEDFFDTNIMEQIRYKLVEIHSDKPLGSTNNPSGFITLHSRVKAIRTDKSGEIKVLLQWMPENILPDCWVSEKSALRCKKVPYSSLPRDVLASLNPQLKDECDGSPRVKQRRK